MSNEAAIGTRARKKRSQKKQPQRDVQVVEPIEPAAKDGPEHDNQGIGGLSPHHEFDLDFTDRRGYRWTGRFKCHVLNIRERASVGLTRSRLTANTPASVIDPATLNILEMQAHLAVALDEAPEWADRLGDLYDVAVISEIYKEVASHEANFWRGDDGSDSEVDGG